MSPERQDGAMTFLNEVERIYGGGGVEWTFLRELAVDFDAAHPPRPIWAEAVEWCLTNSLHADTGHWLAMRLRELTAGAENDDAKIVPPTDEQSLRQAFRVLQTVQERTGVACYIEASAGEPILLDYGNQSNGCCRVCGEDEVIARLIELAAPQKAKEPTWEEDWLTVSYAIDTDNRPGPEHDAMDRLRRHLRAAAEGKAGSHATQEASS